jgi:hypothetical protein
MPRIRSIALCLVPLMLMFPLAPAAEQSPWLEIHSAHFTVITDAGEKRGREVALRFEQMRSVFGSLLGKERLSQPVPLTILAFKSDKEYYQLAPLENGQPTSLPGFFLPGVDQDFIALNLFEEEPWRAVAHDFAHMLLNYNYPPTQGWFDEGLAEYFGSIRVDNRQVEIGGDPELQATIKEDLVGNQRDTHPARSLTELLGAQVWISLPDLFTMKHDTSTYNEGTHHTLYYAESWIVMHYLLHKKKLPETGAYFGLVLNQHVAPEDAIQQAFGMSAAQLEQAVKDYFHSQDALITALDSARQKNPDANSPGHSEQSYLFAAPVGPDDSAITAKPMPEDDARALYAEMQIRIPERREAGLKTLQTLATSPSPADIKLEAKAEAQSEKKSDKKKDKDDKKSDDDEEQLPSNATGNEVAHRVLAWDHIEHGEFEEALTELGDAAALNQRDMWVRYYLSVLKFRMAQAKHTEMQGLANMMQDLKAVLEWYPEFADAYDLLALARNEGGGPIAAMQAERAAIGLSPRNEFYAYHLAQIYIAGKQWDAAKAQLERLKASGNPQLATLARQQLDQAAEEHKYGIPLDSAILQPKLSPQKSPFDVLDEDAAKRAAEEKAQQSPGPADRRPSKFLQGRLVNVDCSQPPAAILTVSADGAVLKLRTIDYKSLLVIGADQFSCDWKDRQVSVNYKQGGVTDGDLVSVEVR